MIKNAGSFLGTFIMPSTPEQHGLHIVQTNMYQSMFFPLYVHLVIITTKYGAFTTCSTYESL